MATHGILSSSEIYIFSNKHLKLKKNVNIGVVILIKTKLECSGSNIYIWMCKKISFTFGKLYLKY